MDKKILTAAVVGAAVVAGAGAMSVMMKSPSTASTPEAKGKEQCYGVAKAGENGCAAANGSHSCGGMSKVDFSGHEWMLVEAGTCAQMGGKLEAFDNPKAGEPENKDAAKGG